MIAFLKELIRISPAVLLATGLFVFLIWCFIGNTPYIDRYNKKRKK